MQGDDLASTRGVALRNADSHVCIGPTSWLTVWKAIPTSCCCHLSRGVQHLQPQLQL